MVQHNFATLAQFIVANQHLKIMKKIIVACLPLFLFVLSMEAQDSISVNKNTLLDQMNEAFDKSNSYQEYKVIKKTQLATLRKNILDSVSALENTITLQGNELKLQKTDIDSLRQNLGKTQQDLTLAKDREDGIEFFGVLTSKSTYNAIMWTIIGILLLIGGFLLYRFVNSHKITNAAQLKMAEMEIELEDYRRNSLEREQKLRRKLQDEINKNRKL